MFTRFHGIWLKSGKHCLTPSSADPLYLCQKQFPELATQRLNLSADAKTQNWNRSMTAAPSRQLTLRRPWAFSICGMMGVRSRSGEKRLSKRVFWRVPFFSAPLRFALETPENLKGAEKNWTLQKHPFGQPFLRTTPSSAPLARFEMSMLLTN